MKQVIALSTDKAANPINLYGATKLCSDKLFVAGNNLRRRRPRPRFAVVRYGNVVGIRGSVIPFFQQCREEDRTLPITDPRMTRFWITLEQGVDFVLDCLERMDGGEIFVPKIPSMKIVDLAEAIAPGVRARDRRHPPRREAARGHGPRDDARKTLEFDDRFVIKPSIHWITSRQDVMRCQGNRQTGRPDDFEYASLHPRAAARRPRGSSRTED